MSERVSSASRGKDRFATRRRNRRRRVLTALGVIFVLLSAGIIYEFRQSAVRISRIEIFGADQSLADIARTTMQGNYFGVIPRDSTFFFPGSRIRSDIIAAHPDIAAVSIFRNGLSGLSIKVNDRVPVGRWCGLAPSGEGVDEYCYVFDANGLIFAAADNAAQTINSFTLYAPLEGATLEPLLATVAGSEELPTTFDFARQLGTFGSPVTHIVLRGDEIDIHLKSGTRITYVLGNEQNAFTALSSASKDLDLTDGSLEYIDLRFDRKVYLKKR